MKVSHKTWLLMLGTFALYFFTRSLWLDEWDSVQFADGIREFNLWDHKPHPPGYPVYIFAGKLLAALGFDPAGLDALVARTGVDAATLQVRLLELELDGLVARLPGGLFQRIAST